MRNRGAGAVAVAVLLLVACGSDGDELRAPDRDAETNGAAVEQPGAGFQALPDEASAGVQLSSSAFENAGAIPTLYSCQGENISPPIDWAVTSDTAVELALVVTDPDANFFVHWVIAGLAPNSLGLEEGAVPKGAVQARNSTGTLGWTGPCPPATHTYVFTLHAMAEPLGLTSGLEGQAAVELIEQSSTASATMTATFTPGG